MSEDSEAAGLVIILENPSRLCGSIKDDDNNEYIISGTVDDLCLRDFVICNLHHYDNTSSSSKPLYAYIGRPGAERDLLKHSIMTTISVLEKIGTRSKHFPKLIKYGYTPQLVFGQDNLQEKEYDPRTRKRPILILEHEHTLISVLPSFSPFNCLPRQFALHLGLGMIRALAALHRAGFVHRMVMPHCFAYPTGCGLKGFSEDLIIVDMSICLPYPCIPRHYVPFVGTLRYSPLRAHMNMEQTPADDIISVIYIVAEFISGRLPWSYVKPTEVNTVVAKKKNFEKTNIFKRLPMELRDLYKKMMDSGEIDLDYEEVLGYFKDSIKRRDPRSQFTLPVWLEHPDNNKNIVGFK